MSRLKSKYGFTLAELLVVIAIIAVLVAVAIPVFSASTEKARLAADHAAVRDAYALIQIANNMQEVEYTDEHGVRTTKTFDELKEMCGNGNVGGMILFLTKDCSALSSINANWYYFQTSGVGENGELCPVCAQWDGMSEGIAEHTLWLPSKAHLKGYGIGITYSADLNKLVLGIQT